MVLLTNNIDPKLNSLSGKNLWMCLTLQMKLMRIKSSYNPIPIDSPVNTEEH